MEEDLDEILRFIRDNYSAIPFSIAELDSVIKSKPLSGLASRKLDVLELSDYVKYLVGKGFINLEHETFQGAFYKVTPSGKIYISSGGFVREREIENGYRKSILETNSSVVSTNKSVRSTNRFQIAALIISSMIALVALLLQYFSFRRDYILNEKLVTFGVRLDSVIARLDSVNKNNHAFDKAARKIKVTPIKKDTLTK